MGKVSEKSEVEGGKMLKKLVDLTRNDPIMRRATPIIFMAPCH